MHSKLHVFMWQMPSANGHHVVRPLHNLDRVLRHHPSDVDMLMCLSASQVERYSHMPDPKLGWQPGDAWGHRRNGYRRMAEKLGGTPLQAWKDTYAREPESSRHIVNDVTPEVKHYITPVVAH